MRKFQRLLCAVVFVALAAPCFAITYIVPTDRDLVRRADAIVIGTAVESHSELRDSRLVTVATFSVDRSIKGSASGTIELVDLGGAVGDRVVMIPGAPRYSAGARYVVFLRRTERAEWTTYGFGLGQFVAETDVHGRELLQRAGAAEEIWGLNESDGSVHVEQLRDTAGFLTFVETTLRSNSPAYESYFVDRSDAVLLQFPEFRPRVNALRPQILFVAADYMYDCGFGKPCKWPSPVASFQYCCGTQRGGSGLDTPSAAATAMSAWNGTGVGISYSLTGVDARAPSQQKGLTTSDNVNDILLNDPHGIVASSGGAAAIGGISNANVISGSSFNQTTEVDVETGDNLPSFVNQSLFVQLLTHELGHTLGFRHSDGTSNPLSPNTNPPTPCAAPSPCASIGQAIMASTIFSGNSIGSLGQWDRDAVQTVYGTGPVCTNAAITAQPQSTSITAGSSAQLTVAATGTSPTYQWFTGNPPNGSIISGQTSTTINVSPTTTTTYYAVVTACGTSTTSSAATVTVTQPTCTDAAITFQPQSASSTPGAAVQLSVSVTGTSPTFQWFTGTPSNASPIAGQTANTTTVTPTATTSYFVRVTACGHSIDSSVATVTVSTACTPALVTSAFAQPSTITAGQSASLVVQGGGTSPLTYQWFTGTSGDLTNPINGATSTIFTVTPTTTTSYWARVRNTCNGGSSANSPTITVTVTAQPTCGAPVITTQPANTTVAPGSSVTLNVVAVGSGTLSYQWFSGSPSGTGTPLGGATSSSLQVSLASTTSYWVRVTNTCSGGTSSTIDSAVATVAVGTGCTNPSITTQPASVSKPIGSAATLTVTAAGTGLHYQWYQGAKGDTTKKVGTDADTFITTAISANTTFWVRVTGSCGTPVDSNAATVTVTSTMHGRASRH